MVEFNNDAIRKKIGMSEAIHLMRDAFRFLSDGSSNVPIRTIIPSADQTGQALFMPSYAPAYQLFGLKMVAVMEENTRKNLPLIQGRMLVMSSLDGTPLALIDAEYLTALRTGAASGLATDILAPKDARVMALFGTGGQAESQIEGIDAVRKIEKILVYATSPKKAKAFCNRINERLGHRCLPATAADLSEADIICTVTTAMKPLFEANQLKKGVHINAVGAFKPAMQEIPSDVMKQALLIVDQNAAALREAGDIIIPIQQGLITADHIHAELGEIIMGRKAGRTSAAQCTLFKSVGNAIQDLALAHALLK